MKSEGFNERRELNMNYEQGVMNKEQGDMHQKPTDRVSASADASRMAHKRAKNHSNLSNF
jgi:hypothetical protein